MGPRTYTGETLESIRAAVAQLHKRNLGIGPRRVTVTIKEDTAILVFEGFLTPIERLLLREKANRGLVLQMRNNGCRNAIPELNRIFSQIGMRVVGVEGNLDCERDRRVVRLKLQKG